MKNILLITAIISFIFATQDNKILNEFDSTSSDSLDFTEKNPLRTIPDKELKKFNLSFCLGPLISLDKDNYNGGYSLGFSLTLPTKIELFKNTFSTSIETIFSSLSNDNNFDGKINSIGLILNSPIRNTPLSYSIGGGYTHHSIHKIAGMGLVSILYKLPLENINISLDFRLQKVINITKEYELDFNQQSHNLYGINFSFGKPININ